MWIYAWLHNINRPTIAIIILLHILNVNIIQWCVLILVFFVILFTLNLTNVLNMSILNIISKLVRTCYEIHTICLRFEDHTRGLQALDSGQCYDSGQNVTALNRIASVRFLNII